MMYAFDMNETSLGLQMDTLIQRIVLKNEIDVEDSNYPLVLISQDDGPYNGAQEVLHNVWSCYNCGQS